jgi:hypothetical protein
MNEVRDWLRSIGLAHRCSPSAVDFRAASGAPRSNPGWHRPLLCHTVPAYRRRFGEAGSASPERKLRPPATTWKHNGLDRVLCKPVFASH